MDFSKIYWMLSGDWKRIILVPSLRRRERRDWGIGDSLTDSWKDSGTYYWAIHKHLKNNKMIKNIWHGFVKKKVVSNWHNLFLWLSYKLMDNREAIDVINISFFFIFFNSLWHSTKYAKKIWSALIPYNMAEPCKNLPTTDFSGSMSKWETISNRQQKTKKVNIFTDDLTDRQHGWWRNRKNEN